MFVLEQKIKYNTSGATNYELFWFESEEKAFAQACWLSKWEIVRKGRDAQYQYNPTVAYDENGKATVLVGNMSKYNKVEISLYNMNHEGFMYDPNMEMYRILGMIRRNADVNHYYSNLDDDTETKRNKRHRKVLKSLGYHIKVSSGVPYLESCKAPSIAEAYKPLAYPFLILHALKNTNYHLTQRQIKETIEKNYTAVTIPRETIGRCLKVLSDYGYPIKHEGQKSGYWLER